MMVSCFKLGLWSVWIFLSIVYQGQTVSVTWNGTVVTGPVFLYQDEILVDPLSSPGFHIGDPNRNGALVCRSDDQAGVGWYTPIDKSSPDATSGEASTTNFKQIRGEQTDVPSLSRLSANASGIARDDGNSNGLWSCRLNGNTTTAIAVGIYGRGTGKGVINDNVNVSVLSPPSSLLTNPPTFTLAGYTRGGPPTTYTWTRNGKTINNSEVFVTSIPVNQINIPHQFPYALYSSTLRVTGRLPGVYAYSVDNRVTPAGMRIGYYTISIADVPTNVTAVQTGLMKVTVSWNASSTPNMVRMMYQISSGTESTITTGTTENLTLTTGVHIVQVVAFSAQHFPNDEVKTVQVTVRGLLQPHINTASLTATSVTISWTQPEFSLHASEYTTCVSDTSHWEWSRTLLIRKDQHRPRCHVH